MKIGIFAGTTEGREMADFLCDKAEVKAFVATEYGAELIENIDNIEISTGRLTTDQIKAAIKPLDMVIDATHPYASIVTENIYTACSDLNIKYFRLIREDIKTEGVVYVNNTAEAVDYLKNKEGKIFISTGSKELDLFTEISDYKSRLTVRVLPFKDSIEKCIGLGIKNTIFKKGPFTFNENSEDFKNCDYLVTKSSGSAGGFSEKIEAAKALNMKIVVIKRPEDKKGCSLEELKVLIEGELNDRNS